MRSTTIIVLLSAAATAHAGTVLHGPTAYLSGSDSPFAGMSGLVIEDFESGVYDLLGVTPDIGNILDPSSFTDSVDGDDGAIDGSGSGGHSFVHTGIANAGVTFSFDQNVLGTLPTHAGIVWTDGGESIRFEAFDAQGDSLGVITGSHADAGFSGSTAEDRFYGIEHDGGIASFRISNGATGLEVDHLQFIVPAPGSIGPVAIAGLMFARRRR